MNKIESELTDCVISVADVHWWERWYFITNFADGCASWLGRTTDLNGDGVVRVNELVGGI